MIGIYHDVYFKLGIKFQMLVIVHMVKIELFLCVIVVKLLDQGSWVRSHASPVFRMRL